MEKIACFARDFFPLTTRKVTDEGFMVARGRMATTGVQRYTARELGLDKRLGVDSNKVYALHRAPEQVFGADSMKTFEHKPITFRHPPGNRVDSSNFRDYAIGHVHDIKRDGNYMDGEMIVNDKDAVAGIVNGTRQLSNGYDFDLDLTPGTAADGTAYDGSQTNIRGNHLAIVDYARGGPGCRIGDEKQKERTMALRTIPIGDTKFKLELEEHQAQVIENFIADCEVRIKAADAARTAAVSAADTARTALETATATHTAAIAELNTKLAAAEARALKPGQLEQLAAERASVIGDAEVLAPDLEIPPKTNVSGIRALVLADILGGDSALKPIVEKVLDGADPAKAESAPIVTAAFAAARAAHEQLSGRQVRHSAADEAFARRLIKSGGADGSYEDTNNGDQQPVGRDLWLQRQRDAHKEKDKATS